MDINKIVDNSTKTVTNPLKSNRAIEVYPDKFIANKFTPTKDIKLNNNIKSNNKISNLDREIERIKKMQELKNINYLTDKDRKNNNLSTYINFDKINKILNDENIHINKDATSKPAESKQIEETEHSQYSILDSLKNLTNFNKTSKDGLPDKAKENAKEIGEHLQLIKKCYNEWSKKDIYRFAQDLLKEFNLNLDFQVADVLGEEDAIGECSGFIKGNGTLNYTKYKLHEKVKSMEPEMQLETIFHELFHAKGNGMPIRIDDTFNKVVFNEFDDIFAECTSHYILDELGIKEKVPFAYEDKLIEMLPKLKNLPKFKDCNNIYDFGKIGFEYKFGNPPLAPWKSIYTELKKIDDKKPKNKSIENQKKEFDTIKYAIDNGYIDKMSSQENINYVAPIIAKLDKDPIGAKFYLLKYLNKTLEKVKQNNNLNETEIKLFNRALILIMDKEGIKS